MRRVGTLGSLPRRPSRDRVGPRRVTGDQRRSTAINIVAPPVVRRRDRRGDSDPAVRRSRRPAPCELARRRWRGFRVVALRVRSSGASAGLHRRSGVCRQSKPCSRAACTAARRLVTASLRCPWTGDGQHRRDDPRRGPLLGDRSQASGLRVAHPASGPTHPAVSRASANARTPLARLYHSTLR